MRVPAIRGSKPQTTTTGQEVESARPQPVRTPVRAPGRLVLVSKVQAAQAPARALDLDRPAFRAAALACLNMADGSHDCSAGRRSRRPDRR